MGPAARGVALAGAVLVLATGWPVSSYAQQPTPERPSPAAPPASQRHDEHRHDQTTPEESPTAGQAADQHAGHGPTQPTTPIPPITVADRAAAFPDVESHVMRDNTVYAFVLFDQLEWQGDRSAGGLNWDATGWVGGDRDRLWFRTEGETNDNHLGAAEAQLFYGRAVARWWDVVVGVRQDVRPGPAQTWVAFGVQGLAPYWFEVEATGYVSDGGQTAVRLEVEYELLLTNHLVLQPLVELNLYGKSNVERGIGAGLSSADFGLRMRYEFRRELAPYVGVTWNNTFGETADLAEAAGETTEGPRLVAGLRVWY